MKTMRCWVIDANDGRVLRDANEAETAAYVASGRWVGGVRFGGALRLSETESVDEASEGGPSADQGGWAWL